MEEKIKLIYGDCVEKLKELSDNSIAAKELNRKFIGIEKEKEYFNIAKSRINNRRENVNS